MAKFESSGAPTGSKGQATPGQSGLHKLLRRILYLFERALDRPVFGLARLILGIHLPRRAEISLTCSRFAVLVPADSKQQAAIDRLTAGYTPGTCQTLTFPGNVRRKIWPLAIWQRCGALQRLLRGDGIDALMACTWSPVDTVALFLVSRLFRCRFGTYLLERPMPASGASARIARRIEEMVVARSNFLLVPNEPMRSYCKDRFKREATLLPPPATRRSFSPPEQVVPGFRIVLKGAVDASNSGILIDIANSLPVVCGREMQLSVHCAQAGDDLAGLLPFPPHAALHGGLSSAQLEQVEAIADLLIIALPLQIEHREYAASAGAAELADALARGKPILAICPENSYVGSYFKANECGLALHANDRSGVTSALGLLVADPGSRGRFVSNALRSASVDFDPRIAQGTLADVLRLLKLPSQLTIAPPPPTAGKLRIAMVTAYDILGIQANGFLLHKYFHAKGHDSRMLVHVKMSTDEAVHEIGTPMQYRINKLASVAERVVSTRTMLSTLGRDIASHPKVADADIVNVQLIHGAQFFSLLSLPRLTRTRRVVLSLHDMFLQTGHCVQAMECERWRTGCGKCPDLVRPFRFLNDTTALNWRLKKSIYDRCNLDLVAASPWMKRRAEQSPLLSRFPIHLIPFGIDGSVYRPADKRAARMRLGIPVDAHVIAFRSQPHGHTMYKGTQYVEAALARYSPSRPTWLITLEGRGGLDSIRAKYGFVELGWINDPDRISEALNAADLFLMPSRAESFGLMAVESMACGTPVIAFEGSALPETIDAPRSGVAVPQGDSDALARAVEDCLRDPARLAVLRDNGLRHVADNYRFDTYGDRYLDLFARLAAGR